MTIQELQQRQQWPLHQKIDHALGTVEAFVARTGKVPYVSFSGGKDSTVLLDLVRRFLYPDIKAVFCNTGNEFPEIVKFVHHTENVTVIRPEMTVRQVLEKYGFPLISKEQALYIRQAKTTKSAKLLALRLNGTDPKSGKVFGKISEKWKYLIKAPFMLSEKCCECLKKRPFANYNKQTGELPILGIMAGESLTRTRGYIRRGGCNSFKENHPISHPISIWTDTDIWAYLKEFKVPYCELYDKGADRTGCMFCGFGAHIEKTSRFARLRELHPKAYDIFMEYTNNGITYREALERVGVQLPDGVRQLDLFEEQ